MKADRKANPPAPPFGKDGLGGDFDKGGRMGDFGERGLGKGSARLVLALLCAASLAACASGPPPVRTPDHVRQMERLSESASKQLRRDDLARAERTFRSLLSTARSYDELSYAAEAKIGLGRAAILRDPPEYASATERFTSARELARKSGDVRRQAEASRLRSEVLVRTGDLPGAREETLAAIRLYEQAGDRIGEAIARGNIALLDNKEGRTDDALAGLRKSEAVISGAGPFSSGLGAVRMNLGLVLLRRGEIAEARTLLEGALSADRHAGDKRGIAADLEALARLEETAGRPETAIDYLRRAARVHASIGGKTLSRDLLARAISLARTGGLPALIDEINAEIDDSFR